MVIAINGPAADQAGSFVGLTKIMKNTPCIAFDEREGYCRILGHHLRFSYCRICQEGSPCFKILDCWFEKFDVRKFIEENYTATEIERFLQPPRSKTQTLMTLILQAQKRMKDE